MKVKQSTKPISEKTVSRNWHLVNLENQILGRMSNEIATLLQGKHKAGYAPYADVGDYVVVINAKKVKVSGKKADTKVYSYYSGYPGGLRTIGFKNQLEKNPTEVIRHAVSGMLPKNKLRDVRLTRLYIYAAETHPHGDKLKK
jgi:large subunit ribosomal protein L13